MKILVTGGSGFLGKRLIRQLLSRRDDVYCLLRAGSDTPDFRAAVMPHAALATGPADAAGRAPAPASTPANAPGTAGLPDGSAVPLASTTPPGRLHVIRGDLNRIASASDALAAADVDVVIHAAAAMGGGAPVLFLNNVVALRRFLDVMQKLPSPPRRFVHVSSFGVYGTGHLRGGDTLDETCPLDPAPHLRDPYSYSKIAQEQVVWEAHAAGRLPLVVIRPGVIYGPGRGSLSNRIGLRVGPLMVRMGGRQQLPYTYVDNVAAAVALAASVPGIEGQAFNVLDDDLPRAKAVLKQYRREVERLRVVPVPYWAIRPLSDACEWYNRWSEGQLPAVLTRYKSMAAWKRLKYTNAKAKSVLGWKPSVSFVEGLRLSHDAACKELEAKKRQAASAA